MKLFIILPSVEERLNFNLNILEIAITYPENENNSQNLRDKMKYYI
jgi:hypothetical protein